MFFIVKLVLKFSENPDTNRKFVLLQIFNCVRNQSVNSSIQSHMTMITGSSSRPIYLGFLQFSLSKFAWSGISTSNHGSKGSYAVSTSDIFNLITRAGVDEYNSQRSGGHVQQELFRIRSALLSKQLVVRLVSYQPNLCRWWANGINKPTSTYSNINICIHTYTAFQKPTSTIHSDS